MPGLTLVGSAARAGVLTLFLPNFSFPPSRMNVEHDAGTHSVLFTERLRLQPVRRRDSDALHAIVLQADVRRYLFDERSLSREETDQLVATSSRLFRESRIGVWGVSRHGSSRLIGFVCLWPFQIEPGAEPRNELGFALDSGHQNQGYALEACQRVIEYARESLGWSSLHASTDLCNTAANRTLWRLDFIESVVVRGRVGPLRIFRLNLRAPSA